MEYIDSRPLRGAAIRTDPRAFVSGSGDFPQNAERPRRLRDVHSRGVPHLPVRVRDGIGLVGPPVIPGVTSCLENH